MRQFYNSVYGSGQFIRRCSNCGMQTAHKELEDLNVKVKLVDVSLSPHDWNEVVETS